MATATWNGVKIADSDDIAVVEGNAYFPADSVNWNCLRESTEKPTYCHWKGFATYFDIVTDGEENIGAAWRYNEPYGEAAVITGRVAFWKGVAVSGAPEGTGLVERLPSQRDGKTGWEALCWLIRHSEEAVLDSATITENTDIPEAEIERQWQAFDVQRYAMRYKWRLAGGANTGEPVRIEKTA